MSLKIRDWGRQEPTELVIVQRDPQGRTRLRSAGGGLYPKPQVTIRRLWYAPPDRVRVDIVQADQVVRTAVRCRDAWWRWDRDDGETAGDLSRGTAMPARLDLVVLQPAQLLATLWLQETGSGQRAGREVVTATGTPRQHAAGQERRFAFEFDTEHGTPLHVATFDADERTGLTEVLSIDYSPSFDASTFSFERQQSDDEQPSRDRSRGRPPRPQALPPATQRGTPRITAFGPVLADHGTVWLTGLPGAGKTTIAHATERLLHQLGVPCCVLDGDELRRGLSSDLGLSRKDRGEQARRTAHIATILADSGVVAIVALVSPYAEDRQRAREIHDAARVGFLEVWVDTPLEICAARDTKGLYTAARAVSGTTAPPTEDGSGLTGLSAPYETPTNPGLHVSTVQQHPRRTAIAIVEKLLTNTAQADVIAPS